MRSVKLRIPGSYWDSQIYSGELIIFGDDGSVQRVDWSAFVDRIANKHPEVQTAIRVAFSDSDLFYNPKVRKVLRDPQIEHPIKSQLNKLADLRLETEATELAGQSQHHDSPFDFLPIDTEIYHNEIYAGNEDGLFSFPRGASLNKVKTRLEKHHDASVFQVKASDRFSAIAAAAGKDGLFDFLLARNTNDRKKLETLDKLPLGLATPAIGHSKASWDGVHSWLSLQASGNSRTQSLRKNYAYSIRSLTLQKYLAPLS